MRFPLIIALCVALVAARTFGLHSHVSHWDDDEVAELASAHEHGQHAEHITAPGLEATAGHFAAHADHGDVDLDEPAVVAGKDPLPKVPVALIALLSVALPVVFRAALRISPPPLRPPKPRSRPYLYPPSHAPPRAA